MTCDVLALEPDQDGMNYEEAMMYGDIGSWYVKIASCIDENYLSGVVWM